MSMNDSTYRYDDNDNAIATDDNPPHLPQREARLEKTKIKLALCYSSGSLPNVSHSLVLLDLFIHYIR